jgi:hypothetical protein
MVLKEPLVSLALQDYKEPLAFRGRQDSKERQASKAIQVSKVPQALKERQALLACLVISTPQRQSVTGCPIP